MIPVAVIGKYPRLPSPPGVPNPRDIARKFAAGEINAEQRETLFDAIARAVCAEMQEAGVNEGTDGLVRWDDPWSGFALRLPGMVPGRLVQEPGTNTLYRVPVAVARPVDHQRRPFLVVEYTRAQALTSLPLHPYVPGPLSLTLAAESTVHESFMDFLNDCAAEIYAEVTMFMAVVPDVRIHLGEPALATRPDLRKPVLDAYRLLARDVPDLSRLILHVWGGSATGLHDVFEMPFGGIGLDFVASPENLAVLPNLSPEQTLYAGIVDATHSRVERPEQLQRIAERIVAAHERAMFCPNCHFTVSRRVAREKLRTLRCLGDTL